MAESWQTATGGDICFGAECHLDPRIAVSRALSELNQMTVFEEHLGDGPQSGDQEAALAAWKREATVEGQDYVVPLDDKVIEARDLEEQSSDDAATCRNDSRHRDTISATSMLLSRHECPSGTL